MELVSILKSVKLVVFGYKLLSYISRLENLGMLIRVYIFITDKFYNTMDRSSCQAANFE